MRTKFLSLAVLAGASLAATPALAADASVATIFGNVQMTGMSVSCVSDDFQPLGPGDLAGHAIMIKP